jgi:N-acetylmuramoyl-L-alanine amidase
MLLQNKLRSPCDFKRRVICRYMMNIVVMLAGAFVVGGMVYAVSRWDTGGHGRVYAVDFQDEESGRVQRTQSGLMGVISAVADMERYSEAARRIDVAGANEEVLAGVSGVDRRAVRRNAMEAGTGVAGTLGYYAQQAVHDNQMSSDEYYTLLQIVEAEATGGDITSKMMVAGVVLNRVKDSRFPDTIYDVVWQTDQFQPTSDGRIYSCSVTQSTIEAVERVLQGEDCSQGALFFAARDSAESGNMYWFDTSLVWLFEYGGHEYYTFQEDL